MIILSGVFHQARWYTQTNLEDDYLVATSKTGYINDELSLEWIKHFAQYSAMRQKGEYRLLLLDGYGSHCTVEIINYCDEQRIILYCLPAHATHLLQPLDVVLFQPYKHWHAEAVHDASRTGCTDFNKVEFLQAIGSIRARTFKASSIQSAFRKTGIIPFNPDRVISQLLATPEQSRPVTLEATTPQSNLPTLQSINRIRKQGATLLLTNQESPSFRGKLEKFVRGSVVQASYGALVGEELGRTQAAEKARQLRQKKNRRYVGRGGVLKPDNARKIAADKEAAEVEKARRKVERADAAAKRKEQKALAEHNYNSVQLTN